MGPGKGFAGLGLALILLAPATGWTQMCTADCDGDGAVTVDEIVTVVNIALGTRPLADCTAGDSSDDGSITVDEIVTGLNFALDGCPQPTPTPTASPSPIGETVRIDVGSASGSRGAVVSVAVTLSGSEGIVVATSNDITYDRTQVRIAETAPVSCTINPAIGSGTTADKMMLAAVLPTSTDVETLRIGIVSFTNNLPIPDGLLFTCNFRIMATASAGNKVLVNAPDASREDGTTPVVDGADGSIIVGP